MSLARATPFQTSYSAQRKRSILELWRISKGVVLTDNIAPHEIAQWQAIERKFGPSGLCLQEVPLELVRNATIPPPLYIRATFNGKGRVERIYDVLGFPIGQPFSMSPQERWMYLVIRSQTATAGICTIVDLAHALWHTAEPRLPSMDIFRVLRRKINKALEYEKSLERVETVGGRGFHLATKTPG